MSGYWSMSNRAVSAPATATLAAPTSAALAGQVSRLRSLQVSLSGPAAGSDRVMVRDGATGVGTILWQEDLSVAANGTASMNETGLDIRGTPGNALTVEFSSGLGTDTEAVNAQGDYVPQGWPLGQV